MVTETKSGYVTTVCSSQNHGYPTYPRSYVEVESTGIKGDAHSGNMRESFRNPGTLKPNDRSISIVALEVMNAMNRKFGTNIQPGDFNDQVVVNGMGNLSDVEIGDHVIFSGGVKLIVTDNAMPCAKLNTYNGEPQLAKALVKKRRDGSLKTMRGILAQVTEPGLLAPGEKVTITKPVYIKRISL